ncbi:conserved exported hypothetical protein [Cupriavidus necator]|uniref:Uncharacterized protein n=1 Tax=Cupriavidus necator TaxID=106590 RepID=A0A1K0ILS3_CUPNE|nr:conserved exported hypothetical protein [Cupriavidus necator]
MTKTTRLATALLLSLAALGAAQAATAAEQLPGDKYGYSFRSGVSASPSRSFDTFTEGSRAGGFDPYGEGARA